MTERILGEKAQGTNEDIAYSIDFSAWGTVSSVTSVSISPSATLTGESSLVGNVVTTPKVSALSSGQVYSLLVTVVISDNTMSGILRIRGE